MEEENFIFEDQHSMRLTHYVMAERLMQVEAHKIIEEYKANATHETLAFILEGGFKFLLDNFFGNGVGTATFQTHYITGKIVLLAERNNCTLESLTLKDIQNIVPNADIKILDVLNVNYSLSKRKSYGGTSPENVLSAIKRAKQRFLKD